MTVLHALITLCLWNESSVYKSWLCVYLSAYFRAYLAELRQYGEHCDSILKDISTTMSELERLQSQYCHVSTQTEALHSACEQLLEDQTRLVETVTCISDKLVYFDDLSSIHNVSHLIRKCMY